MYDIKFPQFINTEYIKQCANCPHMELYAKTERAYTDNGHDLVSHKLRCANLDACLRLLEVTEYEPEEDEEDEWEEDKVN